MLKNLKPDKRDYIPILILFQNSLFLYFSIFLHSITPLSWLRYSLFPLLLSLSVLLNIKEIKRVHVNDLLFALIMLLTLIINAIVFPENNILGQDELTELLWCCFGGYFFGLLVYDFLQREEENDWNLLYLLAVLSTIIMMVFSYKTMASGNVLRFLQDRSDMATAYNSLPCLMILCWRGIKKPNIATLILFGLSIIYIFSLGTRGAMLWLLAFVGVCVLFQLVEHGSVSRKIVALVVFLIILTFGAEIVVLFEDLFKMYGFSVRIIDKFYTGTFLESDSRRQLWDSIIPYINENWLFGNGLFADRRLIGTYVHNIVLEMLLNFGYFGGGLLLLFVIFLIFYSIHIEKSSNIRSIIIALFFSSIGKLLMSSSYLREPLFFVLIAICVSAIRSAKKRTLEEI